MLFWRESTTVWFSISWEGDRHHKKNHLRMLRKYIQGPKTILLIRFYLKKTQLFVRKKLGIDYQRQNGNLKNKLVDTLKSTTLKKKNVKFSMSRWLISSKSSKKIDKNFQKEQSHTWVKSRNKCKNTLVHTKIDEICSNQISATLVIP